jgi:hypothetical protein
MYKYKVVCLAKINRFYHKHPYDAYFISMDYIKRIMSGKLNITVIIIIMLEIFLKKIVHIENVSNFYTY